MLPYPTSLQKSHSRRPYQFTSADTILDCRFVELRYEPFVELDDYLFTRHGLILPYDFSYGSINTPTLESSYLPRVVDDELDTKH